MLRELIPATNERVPLHTNHEVNEQIRQKTLEDIDKYNLHREGIDARLEELDHEWDTERFLEANASTVVLISAILAAFHSMYWLILTGLVGFFLLQHALQGWCPPLPIIRRFGYRTADEINKERTALKFLRGDYAAYCTDPEAAKNLV